MINSNKFYTDLKDRSKREDFPIINKLKKGDLVQKSWVQYYQIDDVDLHKNIVDSSNYVDFYKKIHNYFNGDEVKISELFGNKLEGISTIPFSKAFNSKFGVCLEKSVLYQMARQEEGNTFLVSGFIVEDDIDYKHAFNIDFIDNKPYLVDVERVLINQSTGKKIPYIAPIEDVSGSRAEIILEGKWKRDFSYFVF